MMKIFSGLPLIIFLLTCTTGNESQSESVPSSDPFERNQAMQRGINMGNALEAPGLGAWGMEITEEYLRKISEAGFDAVRIPIRWSAHADEVPPYTIRSSFFDVVDQAIEWAFEHGLEVMINMHHYNEMMEEPEQHRERFLSIWQQVAVRYQDYQASLTFELFNEPHGNFVPELWNSYLAEAIDLIRSSNPGRTLVVGTAEWGGFGGLQHLTLPENDRNIIVTVHYYNPFQFTHQGASWSGERAQEWIGTTWSGTEEEKAAVDEDFDRVLEWAEKHNRPIHLGEYGAYSVADMDSREKWTDYVTRAAAERDFSRAYWEFGAGFGAYNRENNTWRVELLRALIPDSPAL